MALESTPPLSIKNTSGTNRNIAMEVDGNDSGYKSLKTLGGTAGLGTPYVSMLSFLGYSPGPPTDHIDIGGLAHDTFNNNGTLIIGDNPIIVTSSGSWTATWQYGTHFFASPMSYSSSTSVSVGCNSSNPGPSPYSDRLTFVCGTSSVWCDFIQTI